MIQALIRSLKIHHELPNDSAWGYSLCTSWRVLVTAHAALLLKASALTDEGRQCCFHWHNT